MTKRWIFQNRATRTSSPVVSFPRKATLKEESATGQATSLSWENVLMMNTFKKVDVMMLTCWLFPFVFSRNLKIIRKLDLESQLKARVWKPSHLNLIFRFSTQIYTAVSKGSKPKSCPSFVRFEEIHKLWTKHGQRAKRTRNPGIQFRNISDWKDWTVPVSRMKLQLRRMQVRPLARWDCIVYLAVYKGRVIIVRI